MSGFSTTSLRRFWHSALLLLVLALLALSPSGGGAGFTAKVHPAVFGWAHSNPQTDVPVIVQTNGDSASAVSAVERAGGSVERELQIVHALDARVPAGAIASLAAHPSVAWISLDAPVMSTGFVDVSQLASVYPFAVNAPAVWNADQSRTGRGVTVAVIDTGISNAGNADFQDAAGSARVAAEVSINSSTISLEDGYGHGTHVAGIIGGDGDLLSGRYIGIAPESRIIDVKIADDNGGATIGDAIAGIQWVVENKDVYNIRVLNLSLHSSVAQSYRFDPLDAAVEFAWFSGIVVVVSSGNMGTSPDAVHYPPANDPFVIVVGATDDMGTASRDDDVVAFFSSRGTTQDGFVKPDVVAPGRRIVSNIDAGSVLARTYPDRFVDRFYFRMSGTSMAAPVVSGIVALMLESNPNLTPGQVKHVLLQSSEQLNLDFSARAVLADRSVFYSGEITSTDEKLSPGRMVRMSLAAKMGLIAHVLGDPDPSAAAAAIGLDLGLIGPPGANLDNVDWEAIKWNAIKWNAIKWDAIKWDAIKWNAIKWNAVNWDAIKWNAIKWSAIKWDAIKWNAIKWSDINWDAIKWNAVTSTEVEMMAVDFASTDFDSLAFDSFLSDPALRSCDRGRRDCSSFQGSGTPAGR